MAMPVLKTVLEPMGGLSTQVEEPTSMISSGMAMAGGAAAGGGLAFMMCVSKCPGGVGGAMSGIAGMIGSMNPFSMMSKKDEKDADEEEAEEDSMKKMEKQVDTIEKMICNMNCKMTGLLGGAAGAAAGKVAANQMNKEAAPAAAPAGGGGFASKLSGFKLQMLDEWNAPQFFVVTKQIDKVHPSSQERRPGDRQAEKSICDFL